MKIALQGLVLSVHPETNSEEQALRILGHTTPWSWCRHSASWKVPTWAVSHLSPSLRGVLPNYAIDRNEYLRSMSAAANPWFLLELPDHLNLFPYQARVLPAMLAGRHGVWFEAGLGKTITTLSAYYLLKKWGHIDGMVIVGPEAGRHVWCEESSDSAKWIGEPGTYIYSGTTDRELRAIPPGIIYTTPAKIWRKPYNAFIHDVIRTGRYVLVLDEVHTMAGALSRRFRTLNSWEPYCRWIWALSATPMRNYIDSFWSVYKLLTGDHYVDYYRWEKWFRRGVTKKWYHDRIATLGKHLAWLTTTVTKKEAAPWLPPVTERVIPVEMRGLQRSLYEELVTVTKVRLASTQDEEERKKALLQCLTYQTSLASHLLLTDTQEGWDPEQDVAKLQILRELVECSGEQKVLIWSWHPKVCDWILSHLPYPGVRYHGAVGTAERELAVHRFNNEPESECKLFVGNPMAAGTSLNLGAGTIRIFWDLGWSRTEYYQACNRNDRITRTEPITSYVLISAGSIEELIWERIQEKEAMSNLLIGQSSGSEMESNVNLSIDRWQQHKKRKWK